ncbi:MAG: hypothetical protein ABSF64_24185 [Bryobacteraceae bacterium]|jgi:hypothetical protein
MSSRATSPNTEAAILGRLIQIGQEKLSRDAEVLQICKSAATISPDVYRILEEKLKKRNSAAHPSDVSFGAPEAETFIHEIVNNVVLKFTV